MSTFEYAHPQPWEDDRIITTIESAPRRRTAIQRTLASGDRSWPITNSLHANSPSAVPGCFRWRTLLGFLPAYLIVAYQLLCGVLISTALAAPVDSELSDSDVVRQGMSKRYVDAQSGELVFPAFEDQETLTDRNSSIASPKPTAAARKPMNLDILYRIIQVVFFGLAAFIILGAIVYLCMNLTGTTFSFGRGRKNIEATQQDLAVKISQLPFELDTPVRDLLDMCRDAMAQGDYDRAIVFLFGHMLVRLDGAHKIRLRRGKTNRTYWRELRRDPELRSTYELTMLAFEHVFFGRHSLSENQFRQAWDQLNAFERLTSTGTAAANVSDPRLASGVTQ
jgi:hypothetical protein